MTCAGSKRAHTEVIKLDRTACCAQDPAELAVPLSGNKALRGHVELALEPNLVRRVLRVVSQAPTGNTTEDPP